MIGTRDTRVAAIPVAASFLCPGIPGKSLWRTDRGTGTENGAEDRKETKFVIHQYKSHGYNIVMDVNSGSVHVVDEIVYDMIPCWNPL